jgi:hypothetical protein
VLGNPSLRPLGALLILVAAVAGVIGLNSEVMLSLIVGPGAGSCLLIFGVATAVAGLTKPPEAGH